MNHKEKISDYCTLLEKQTALQIIEWASQTFGTKLVLASSMGAEDQALTDMVVKANSEARIITLDTGRLFPETYHLIEKTQRFYKKSIEVYFPDYKQVEPMVMTDGINLFYDSVENRKKCCHIRKIEPLERAFKGAEAWICGLRRDQSITRTANKVVEWDEANQLVKINPLINWNEEQVWEYITLNNVPYNKLHDAGFRSIGCQPCTRAVREGEDVRSGRWWWENPEHKECGLHAPKSK